MKASLIDTDILSMFFRGQAQVVDSFRAYLSQYNTINLSMLTYYEIVSGLKYRDAHKQIELFLEFAAQNTLLPLTPRAVDIAAEKYAELRKAGVPIDDIDLLIAGTAIANGLALVTHNTKHFDRISDLETEDWAEAV